MGMANADATTLGGYYSVLAYALICASVYAVHLGVNAVSRGVTRHMNSSSQSPFKALYPAHKLTAFVFPAGILRSYRRVFSSRAEDAGDIR